MLHDTGDKSPSVWMTCSEWERVAFKSNLVCCRFKREVCTCGSKLKFKCMDSAKLEFPSKYANEKPTLIFHTGIYNGPPQFFLNSVGDW